MVLDQNGVIEQREYYYPFGASFPELTWDGNNAYKYNGKELDKMHGLNLYDYSARHYDPAIGRFTSVDPHAESYYSWSPYNYVGNNPVKRTDPTGMDWADQKAADRLSNAVNRQIEKLGQQNDNKRIKINSGKSKDSTIEKLKKQINENNQRIAKLKQSIRDIDRLTNDINNTYVLNKVAGDYHQVKKGSDGRIYIDTSDDGTSIHEITHVRQSLDAGGLEFGEGDLLLNAGSKIKRPHLRLEAVSDNEVEAYQIQFSLYKYFIGNARTMNDIDVHSVGNLRNNKGQVQYPLIKMLSDYKKMIEKQMESSSNK